MIAHFDFSIVSDHAWAQNFYFNFKLGVKPWMFVIFAERYVLGYTVRKTDFLEGDLLLVCACV